MTERVVSCIGAVHLFICLSVCLSVAKAQKKTRFSQILSNLELWCLLSTYKKLCNWAFQTTHYWIPKIKRWMSSAILKIDMMSLFSADGGPILVKFWRLVQNDMSMAVIWSKSKADVEFQYGGHFSEFSCMSSQSHLLHCRVLPPGEFNVVIPELWADCIGL